VTESTKIRCLWCGAVFALSRGPGRPRAYCRPSHRQRSYEARRLAKAHALGREDVLISRSQLEALRDAVYAVEAAMEDVEADLTDTGDPGRFRSALWHLYGAAGNLRGLSLEPRAVGG
jgi:hypothetical protein